MLCHFFILSDPISVPKSEPAALISDFYLTTKAVFRLVELSRTRLEKSSNWKCPSGYKENRERMIKVTRVNLDFSEGFA